MAKKRDLLIPSSGYRNLIAEDVRPDLWLDAGAHALTRGARWVDGVDQRFVTSSMVNPGVNDFWVSFWFYQEAYVQAGYLWLTGAGSNGADGFAISVSSATLMRISVNDSVQGTRASNTISALAQKQWIHFAVNFDRDGSATLYKNGVSLGAVVDISGHQASLGESYSLNFGTASGGGTAYNGRFAYCGYGTGLLTVDDIQELYNGGNGASYAELSAALSAKTVHYWNCTETDPAGVLVDSVSANNGTPNGTSTSIALAGSCRKLPSVNNTPCSDVYSRLGSRPTFRAPIPAARPTYLTAGINSRPALVFDGTADCLEATTDLPTGTACELAIAFQTGATAFTGRTQTLFAWTDYVAANKYGRVGIDGDGHVFVEVNSAGTVSKVTGSTSLDVETAYVLSVDSSGTAYSLRFAGAGADEVLTEATAGDNNGLWIGDTTGVDSVLVGALRTSGGYSDYFEGRIAQVVLCDADKSARLGSRLRAKLAGLYAALLIAPLVLADGTGILLSNGTGLVY